MRKTAAAKRAFGQKRSQRRGAVAEHRQRHIGVRPLVVGIHQPGFGRELGFGNQRIAHAPAQRDHVEINAIMLLHGLVQLSRAVAAHTRAFFCRRIAAQTSARRQAGLRARQRFAAAINHINIPQPPERVALLQPDKRCFQRIGRTVCRQQQALAAGMIEQPLGMSRNVQTA